MAELPGGTVTLVFTDIEGSTRLLEALAEQYGKVLAEHRKLLRDAFSSSGGVEVDTQGDALFYAFSRAKDAVLAAAEAQRAIASHPWAQGVSVAVRMGIHTGEPALGDEGYVGADVHRAARICSAAHGGQVVVSEATSRLVGDGVGGVELRDLGVHSLKDLSAPQHLYQLVIEGLRQDFPAIRTHEGRPNNLPRQLTPLLGREREIAQGCRLLEGDAALVSLTGPGGTGKTRLALALGQELLDSFPHGVFFVDLSATTDPSLVLSALAQTLSLRESGTKSLAETLSDHLATKQMLLILDNFEQVIEAAPEVSSLLALAPGVKVITTTRERLRLRGERELAVPPLELPDPEVSDPEILATSPAVALFTERADAVTASFELTGDNAASVAEICRKLDGLPLALELAAARIRTMSPSSLLRRLDRSLEVLTGGPRDLAARQRTLRAAISWSYELLDEDESRLFSRLGVFAGGFIQEAAEAVCDRGDLSLRIWDGLSSLVDKSLVRLTDQNEEHFSMLETLRSFALEQLEESGEADEIHRVHAEFFRGLAQEAEPHLVGKDQKEWLDRLEQEDDNLRSALEWSLHRAPHLALELGAAQWRFWDTAGRLSEGRSNLDAALRSGHGSPPELVAKGMYGAGCLAEAQDDYEMASDLIDNALSLSRELGDHKSIAMCLDEQAWIALMQNAVAKAEALAEDAVSSARTVDDKRSLARALNTLGAVAVDAGDYARAQKLYQEALTLHASQGDAHGQIVMLMNIGELYLLTEQLPEAERTLQQALDEARKLGATEQIIFTSANLGDVDLSKGDPAAAASRFVEAVTLAQRLASPYGVANSLEGLASVAVLREDLVVAANLFGAAAQIRKQAGIPMATTDRRLHGTYIEQGRRQLGENTWENAFLTGSTMDLETAIAVGVAQGDD